MKHQVGEVKPVTVEQTGRDAGRLGVAVEFGQSPIRKDQTNGLRPEIVSTQDTTRDGEREEEGDEGRGRSRTII